MNKVTDTKHVVHLSSNITKSCEHCDEHFDHDETAAAANHYIKAHG